MNIRKLSTLTIASTLIGSLYTASAYSDPTYIYVNDMSLVHYQLVADGRYIFAI